MGRSLAFDFSVYIPHELDQRDMLVFALLPTVGGNLTTLKNNIASLKVTN